MNRQFMHACADYKADTGEALWKLGQRVGKGPNYISLVINGRLDPKTEDKKNLCEILGKSIEELFPKEAEVSNA